MKVPRWVVVATLVLVSIGCLVWVAGSIDSHHTNLKYLLWKAGFNRSDPSIALHFMNVDSDFRQSLEGKTKEEVQEWFPNLVPPEKGNAQQKLHISFLKGMDFLWIGDSQWGIEFRDGRVKDFHLPKG